MTKFEASIQLHHAGKDDYEKLTMEMRKASFHIKKNGAADGEKPADKRAFNYHGNRKLQYVANAVYRAIKKTGRSYSFTILQNKTAFP